MHIAGTHGMGVALKEKNMNVEICKFPANESVHLYKRSKRNSTEVPKEYTQIHDPNFGMV